MYGAKVRNWRLVVLVLTGLDLDASAGLGLGSVFKVG